ncbi:MAG: CRISPR-associated protein Csx3 [Thermodesulfovibrionales bacterium]|nr:CRISPR-associated protein Csx3 [Thermodesulfovibrionales bacterium]
MALEVIINLETLYNNQAKINKLDEYIKSAKDLAGEGNDIILTGAAPVWLYLKIAHALHGKARKLIYRSPVTGDVVIFDHSPD